MTTYADIGPISSGTMRTEDLLETFADMLETLDPSATAQIAEARSIDSGSERADHLLEELFEALDCFSPPYAYFGAHEGDGACYGFWPSMDSLEDDVRCDEVCKIEAGDDVPADFTGDYVMSVSDHGNVALYERVPAGVTKCPWQEVWSIV